MYYRTECGLMRDKVGTKNLFLRRDFDNLRLNFQIILEAEDSEMP